MEDQVVCCICSKACALGDFFRWTSRECRRYCTKACFDEDTKPLRGAPDIRAPPPCAKCVEAALQNEVLDILRKENAELRKTLELTQKLHQEDRTAKDNLANMCYQLLFATQFDGVSKTAAEAFNEAKKNGEGADK